MFRINLKVAIVITLILILLTIPISNPIFAQNGLNDPISHNRGAHPNYSKFIPIKDDENVTSPYSGQGLHITEQLNWCYMSIPRGKTTYQDFGVWYSTFRNDSKVYRYHLEISYPVDSKDTDWITVYPDNGTLVPELSHAHVHEILIDTSKISIIPKNPFYADHTGGLLKYTHFAFVTAVCGDERATMLVRINVVPGDDGPTLKYWPPRLEFSPTDPDGTSKTFKIWNSGSGTLTYSFRTDVPWIEVSPKKGTSTGEKDTITVTIYPSRSSGCGCNSDKIGHIYIDSDGGVVPPGVAPGYAGGEGRITIWRWNEKTWDHDIPTSCRGNNTNENNNDGLRIKEENEKLVEEKTHANQTHSSSRKTFDENEKKEKTHDERDSNIIRENKTHETHPPSGENLVAPQINSTHPTNNLSLPAPSMELVSDIGNGSEKSPESYASINKSQQSSHENSFRIENVSKRQTPRNDLYNKKNSIHEDTKKSYVNARLERLCYILFRLSQYSPLIKVFLKVLQLQ